MNGAAIFSCALALLSQTAMTQSLQGRVIDAGSGTPVAYATVLCLRQGLGVTADSSGRFELPERAATDSLLVSCVGYLPARFAADSTRTERHLLLQRKQQTLRSIVVGRQTHRTALPGFLGSSDFSLFSSGLQTQVGQHLVAPVPGARLRSVIVGTSVSLFEHYTYRFRLRVYDWDTLTQKPGAELTDADIQVQGSARNIRVRLDSFGIILPRRDFVVAVEWLWLPENRYRFSDKSEFGYRPSIRMKNNNDEAGEAWSGSAVWGGWRTWKSLNRQKTSAAISAVVTY